MQVKNISTRPHHIGDVLIAPEATGTIDDSWANAINKQELEVVKAPAPAKGKAEKPSTEPEKSSSEPGTA